MHRILSILDKC